VSRLVDGVQDFHKVLAARLTLDWMSSESTARAAGG
jgi:hypothetical protein